MIDACCTHSNVVNFGVTGHDLYNIEESLSFSFLKSELRSSNLFRNVSATNEGGVGQIHKFCHDIGCHGNVPSDIAKWMNGLPILKIW